MDIEQRLMEMKQYPLAFAITKEGFVMQVIVLLEMKGIQADLNSLSNRTGIDASYLKEDLTEEFAVMIMEHAEKLTSRS